MFRIISIAVLFSLLLTACSENSIGCKLFSMCDKTSSNTYNPVVPTSPDVGGQDNTDSTKPKKCGGK
jgi:hypothetical protein